jgi:DNA-directed RNA polymerase subunit RPC12/RpoP
MENCKECGRELHLIEGYRHPLLGEHVYLCSDCFDEVYESLTKWRDANLPYIDFFNKKLHYKRL